MMTPWVFLGVGLGVIYAFTAGWLISVSPLSQFLAWSLGAISFSVGAINLVPGRYHKVFLYVGFLLVFGFLFSAVFLVLDKRQSSNLPDPFKAIPSNSLKGLNLDIKNLPRTLVDSVRELFAELISSKAEGNNLSKAIGKNLYGKVVRIADGDTFTLLVDRTQYRIRLGEIDTPESGQPWGTKAKQALAEKVHRNSVKVEVTDLDRYGRLIGKVWLGGRDINRELVREGHAWVFRRYFDDRSLLGDERKAKASPA